LHLFIHFGKWPKIEKAVQAKNKINQSKFLFKLADKEIIA
jgi:hypothetical protein